MPVPDCKVICINLTYNLPPPPFKDVSSPYRFNFRFRVWMAVSSHSISPSSGSSLGPVWPTGAQRWHKTPFIAFYFYMIDLPNAMTTLFLCYVDRKHAVMIHQVVIAGLYRRLHERRTNVNICTMLVPTNQGVGTLVERRN